MADFALLGIQIWVIEKSRNFHTVYINPTCFHVSEEIYESCLEREKKCIYQFGTITWNITGLFVTFYFLFSFAGEIRAAMSEGTNGSARSYISPVQFFLYFVVGKINLRHKIIIFYLVEN